MPGWYVRPRSCLPDHFQVIIRLSPYHSTLYSLAIESAVKRHSLCSMWRMCVCFFLFLGVGLRRPLFGLLYQPRMIDDDCGAVGGMRIARRNGSTRRKPAPVTLRLPQIACDLTWDRSRAAAEGSRLSSVLIRNVGVHVPGF
jgi:hypothetical protein